VLLGHKLSSALYPPQNVVYFSKFSVT
jgi:hypothetical protein